MAKRPVYWINKKNELKKTNVSFKWFSGFSTVQKQKSITELHKNFLRIQPQAKILEISSVSKNRIGIDASAFNLKLKTTRGTFYIEQLFQASKYFEKSGTQTKILKLSPKEGKKITRKLNQKEKIIYFELFNQKFPTIPVNYFYNWLYLNGLKQNTELSKKLNGYDAFTDINANPEYTYNTQAEACALYISLIKKNIFAKAMNSPEAFLKLAYYKEPDTNCKKFVQLDIFK